jgi:hypothetical protein
VRRTAAALPKRDTVKLIQKKYSPGAFAFGGAVFLFMALSTIGGRLLTEVDGVITERQLTTGHRPAAIYTVRNSSGSTSSFTAGSTDASLPRDLPIGSHVTKRKWELGYTLHGRQISDLSVAVYGSILSLAVCMLWFSAALVIQQRRQSASSKRCV